MSMHAPEFAAKISQILKQYHFYAPANAELGTIATALGADVTTHDKTIESVVLALKIHSELHSPFTNEINLQINKGKAGNLSNATMIAAMDAAIGTVSKPGNTAIPYASANASPPIVGTVCSCTTGLWIGVPTSYSYQWKRDGATNIGSNAATYTLVSADVGANHKITCVVTATNAQGSTVAPPSNAITVP
jgi:hypothetical protein